jgi:hypothetical protein
MRAKIVFLLSPFVFIVSLQAHAVTVKHALSDISGVYDAEIYIEDGIENEEAIDVPDNSPSLEPRDMLQKYVKGYSYAIYYEGDETVKIMVFKSGVREYIKIPTIKKARDNLPSPENQTIVKSSPGNHKTSFNIAKANYQTIPPKNWMQSYYYKDCKLNASGIPYKETAMGFRVPGYRPDPSKAVYAMAPPQGFYSSMNQSTPVMTKETAEKKAMANSAMLYQLQQQAIVSRQKFTQGGVR